MPEKWNAIVIGAGVGGLAAAARLVKAGLRVLVLEKKSHPGGTAYVYTRKGFTFPMGPLGFSSPELVRQTFTDLGKEDLPEFTRVHYQISAFGLKVPLSLPFSKMREEMAVLFPADAQDVKRFFDYIDKILAAMRFPEIEQNRSLLEQAGSTSAPEYLGKVIRDWRLRRILGSLGTNEPYTSLPLLAAMWNVMCEQGIWYPKGGMRSFCHCLANTVTEAGKTHGGFGEIRTGSEVKEIRTLKGKVAGVTLKDGVKIDAVGVISNADYKTTFLRLAKPQALPPSWYRAVAKARQTNSILQVSLGVDSSPVDLSAFSEASRLIFRTSNGTIARGGEEINWLATKIEPEFLARQELEVSLWSRDDPGLAPEGKSVIVIRTEADFKHFTRFRPGWRQRAPEYHGYKMGLAQALVRQVSTLLSGIENAVTVMDVATPLTFEELGGRSQGAVAGWSWDFADNPSYQPVALVRTPIQGLYMAGYQAYSALFMGGVPMAIQSGQRAAEALLEGAPPTEEILIPGVRDAES